MYKIKIEAYNKSVLNKTNKNKDVFNLCFASKIVELNFI